MAEKDASRKPVEAEVLELLRYRSSPPQSRPLPRCLIMTKPAKSSPAQFETTWLFPHVKEVVRPDEVAVALNINVRQVLHLCEAGYFVEAPIGDAPLKDQVRKHRRIMRFSVEAWWLNRMEDASGTIPPVTENPQIKWWREELRRRELAAPNIDRMAEGMVNEILDRIGGDPK